MKMMKIIFVFQIIMFLSIIFNIVFFRQIIGFIYLTFLPGLLLIKFLKINNIDTLEIIFISIGLSICFLMFVGLLINEIFFNLGVEKPLSSIILINIIIIILLSMNIINLLVEPVKFKYINNKINLDQKTTIKIISLFSIPISFIFGSIYNNNFIIIFATILLVTIMFIVNIFTNDNSNINIYRLVIFIIAFSFLLQRAFISNYLIGYDVFFEYYVSKLTYLNLYWDKYITNIYQEIFPTLYTYNSMLSITILPTIYSHFMKTSLLWSFKIVYPIIFSVIPIIVFSTLRYIIKSKIAFLSTIFFISTTKFLQLGNSRQIIGELFLGLLIFVIINNRISIKSKRTLSILFSAALTISHYSLSFLFIFYIIALWIFQKIIKYFHINIIFYNNIFKTNILLLILSINFFWYTFVTIGPNIAIITLTNRIINSIGEFFIIESRGKTIYEFTHPLIAPTLIQQIINIFPKILYFFLVIGILNFFLLRSKNIEIKFDWQYALIVLMNTSLLCAILLLPKFGTGFGAGRWLHVLLFVLSPFSVLGGSTFFRFIGKSFELIMKNNILSNKTIYNIICILFLFNLIIKVGLLYEITGDQPMSISISMKKMMTSDNTDIRATAYGEYIPEQDVFNSIWLSKHLNDNSYVYADPFTSYHDLIGYGNIDPTRTNLLRNNTLIFRNSYIYLSSANILNNDNLYYISEYLNTNKAYSVDLGLNKICTNGKGAIYLTHRIIRIQENK